MSGEKQIVAAGFSNLSGGMGVSCLSVGEGLCIDKQREWELHSCGRFTYNEAEPFPSMCRRCPRLFTSSFSLLSVKEESGSALRHPTSSV